MQVEQVTLEGTYVRLEPLSLAHYDQLCAAGLDEELWRWTTSYVSTREEMRSYIETALKWRREGTALPFATVAKPAGVAVGSTRYANIDADNRHLEIGWTWISCEWQRTPVNTEAKYLMLQHAFETLGCMRVEFKTDSLNEKSRSSLLRIGAMEEGIFRNHMITASGRIRHSVWYSVIDTEWPQVKANLEAKLSHPFTSRPSGSL
jgi:RimJ/RimL family protein N-acetyltransferase